MLHDLTDDPLIQLLVHETRLASTAGPALAHAHRRVGAALAPWAARRLRLVEVSIDHVAGQSAGVALAPDTVPNIVVLMRAGLFVAEGLWDTLGTGALVPWTGEPGTMDRVPIQGRPLIVVDAVINSGRSIVGALDLLEPRAPSSVTVVALVANDKGLAELVSSRPNVDFVAARVSKRSYVGRGPTDTGARLFGTTAWESAA